MMKGISVALKCGRFYGLDNKPEQLGKVFFSNLHVRDIEDLR